MPKINVYLPDDLAAAVKAAGIPVSAVCQKALADAVQVVTVARKGVAALRDPGFDPGSRPEFAGRLGERMTARLRAAIDLGRQAAGEGPLGTAQLLVGLLDEGDNLATRLLPVIGADADALREAAVAIAVEESLPTAAATEGGFWAGMTMAARGAIAASLEASIELGHNYIGCEHLLLGLLAEPESGAGQVLHAAGLDAPAVRRAVGSALAGFAQARQTATPAGGQALQQVLDRLEAIETRLGAAGL
ncbi:Clp protease N-terminal domain-containing protein [Streptacidiphilus jiangxiensis]|uniref:ATP-dependent Clp protease ATP-binding subunit ClpC n=1 Tax=Streptacidiphilus jiangxiensis TaxID=235985 RepID=A0A1H7KZZ8_STRJI|nr:Clp protease N-terminal domain-containing protein [Streptacidiphilus jiangxiensis]SEK91577.1 ATP-dependent Clp protease ATP-binding subunit ClpC [Streptacidiphilus jiangxiensis]